VWVGLVLGVGCANEAESPPTLETPPSELRAFISVGGPPVIALASLTTVADGKDFALENDDAFELAFRDRSVVLEGVHSTTADNAPVTFYQGLLPDVTPLQGETVTITLHRGSGDLVSTAVWPAPVVIDPPPLFVSRAADFTFTWTPGGNLEGIAYSVSGFQCLSVGGTSDDTGTVTIPANTLVLDANAPPTCGVNLSVQRGLTGTLAQGFGGGKISTELRAFERFASTP